MKNKLRKLAIIAVITTLVFQACTKIETRPNPTMAFSTDTDTILTSGKDSLSAGDTVQVGLNCTWNGTDELRTLSIYLNNQYVNTYAVPSNVITTGIIYLKIIKTNLSSDSWVFELTDANGQRGYLSLYIPKSTKGNSIKKISNIILGAQSNAGIGNFFSVINSTVYSLQNATNNQEDMDLLLGYNSTDKAYLASPAADLTGDYDLSAWTVKNNTLFCPTTRSVAEFDMIETDLPIISSFYEDQATDKIVSLTAGTVYSFKTADGKLGLIKIISVPSSNTGTSNFEIKIQP
ncbi:MAG: hypothetical protein U0W24_25490 [Bacteroidales bacterium]